MLPIDATMTAPPPPPKNRVFDPGDMAALPYQTNIDRRHATRTAPLRVLCLGQSRTGTNSLRRALIDLGHSDVYHFASVLQENPPDAALWIEALRAKFQGVGTPYGKPQWDALLGHCQAVTDNPVVIFHKELLAAYPEAKVVLTERNSAEQWFHSQMATVVPNTDRMLPKTWLERLVAKWFSPFDTDLLTMADLVMHTSPTYSALWHDFHHGTDTAKQVYDDYNAEIKRLVPKERLLVFNVKEGWGPLCEFLGEKVPGDQFPRSNDREIFAQRQAQVGSFVAGRIRRNMAVFGAGVAVVVALVSFAVTRIR